jgi:hypothetical protein
MSPEAAGRIVVDTSVWSLAVRRRSAGDRTAIERRLVLRWRELVRENLAVMIGPVRQELLAGIAGTARFETLRDHLRGFDDEQLSIDDYETAARFNNVCRSQGVAGSQTDFLICAVAAGHDLPIFTTDPDFTLYARHLPIRLYIV